MKMMRRTNGTFLIIIGLLLIAVALLFHAYNLYEAERAERSVNDVMEQLDMLFVQTTADTEEEVLPAPITPLPEPTIEQEIPDYILDPSRKMPTKEIDGQAYIGIIELPTLSLKLPVLASWDEALLKIAPCRYDGSAYNDSLIIAGHDFTSHFKKLRDLSGGETVLFCDMDGNVFTYEVTAREIIDGTDIAGMFDGEWDLTLFTCTIDGRSRAAIRCERCDA